MGKWIAAIALAGVFACTEATPVGTILGERDFSGHIPEQDRSRVSVEDHTHRFELGETGATVEARITTGAEPTTGAAWVRSVRFVVVNNDGQQIHPPGISGPLNMGTPEKPVASYSFHISFVKEHFGGTESGTTAGRFAGDGSFAVDGGAGGQLGIQQTSGLPAQKEVLPSREECRTDADCSLMDFDCSPCRCPGPQPAVNTLWLKHEREKCDALGDRPAPIVQCTCPKPEGDESTWPTGAACVKGKCEAR